MTCAVLLFTIQSYALVNGIESEGLPDLVRLRLSNGFVCSGAFIDPYTVLTAAHCAKVEPSVTVVKIESENDVAIDVIVKALIPNPEFTEQSWPASDVGLIKTSENKKFAGNFKLADANNSFRGNARLYGCGRNQSDVKIYARSAGTNTYTRLGSVLFFIGFTAADARAPGENVSIAHNDSGGPIADEKNHVIGVMTTTTLDQSVKLGLPALGTGTSVTSEANSAFIRAHLGAIQGAP